MEKEKWDESNIPDQRNKDFKLIKSFKSDKIYIKN